MSDYDSIAGFDTSSLGLDAASLQSGLTGVEVAAAAFGNLSGPARYANGIALIEAAAADAGVSAARALFAFAHELSRLDGDNSHMAAVGVEIAHLVATDALDLTQAMVDFTDAAAANQITKADALQAALAMAADGPVNVQILAGRALADIVQRRSEGGGEGGGSGGAGSITVAQALQAIHDAVVGGSLSELQAYGLLAGTIVSSGFRFYMGAMSEFNTLIAGDQEAGHLAIGVLAVAAAITGTSTAGSIADIATLYTVPAIPFADVVADIHAAIVAGTLSPAAGLGVLVGVTNSFGLTNEKAIAIGSEAAALVDGDYLSPAEAVDALVQAGQGITADARLLVGVSAADPDLVFAAGLRLATLIDTESTTPRFVATIITSAVADGLPATAAVSLLTAMATVPGGIVADWSALNAAADAVRGLVEGVMSADEAAATVVASLAPLGLTAGQGVTILIALGASGTMQLLGSTLVFVGNEALAAAAGQAIAGLIHDQDLSPAEIGAALDGVFPVGLDSASLALSTLIRAAVALAALEPGGFATVGAALALASAGSPFAMSGISDGVQGGLLTGAEAIALAAGYAGAGSTGQQVAGGREFHFILTHSTIDTDEALAELASLVAGDVLTPQQAIVLLAGLAIATPPRDPEEVFAALAAYMDADPAAGAAALGAAVPAALAVADGVFVVATTAALGSAQTADLLRGTMLSWVDAGDLAAGDLATQLLGLANGGSATLQALAGATIAALIDGGSFTAPDAMTLVEAAVPATLDADVAIVVLVHMAAAGDSALQAAVETEINTLIANGVISLQDVIAELQAMLPGASPAVLAVLDAELAILLTDPATLAETAGLGSPAQVQAAALAIAALFDSDPVAAQAILDALSGRIQDGSLTGNQAAGLLAKIYAQGGSASAPVLDTISDLTTVQGGQSVPDVSVPTMADAIVAQATAGMLTVDEIFDVLGELLPRGAETVRGAFAGLISGGTLPVEEFHAAIVAGSLDAANGIAVLGRLVPGGPANLLPEVVAEIQTLVGSNASLAAQALPVFVRLATTGDHDLRLMGHDALEGLAVAVPGMGSAAFLALLASVPSLDAGLRADTLAGLTDLLAAGSLTTAEAVQHIDDQLSPGNPSPLINPTQAVNVLVALSAFDGARTQIYDYIRQEVAANGAAQAAGPTHPLWGFTAQPVIAALARGTSADLDHVEETALTIVSIGVSLTTSQILTNLSQGSIGLVAVVAGFINRVGATTDFGAHIAGRLAGLSLQEQLDSLDVISSLVGSTADDLQMTDATELLLAVYAGGAKAAALAELSDIGAGFAAPGGVCFAIVAAMTAGTTTVANGVEVMAALAASGEPGFDSAVASSLGEMLVGGDFSAAEVMSALEAGIQNGALTALEVVELLQDVLSASLDPADLPATAALQGMILAEIDALIAADHITLDEAVAAMASAASGLSAAMLLAIGAEIAAFVGGHAGSEASAVTAIVAASSDGIITGVEALGLLVGASIHGAEALQVAAGGGIAGLVADGSVTLTTGAVGIYNAYLSSGLSLDGLVAVTAGLWASDGMAVGAEVLYQVASHGFETYAGLADRLAIAVEAGTLTLDDMVEGGVAIVLRAGAEAGADFLSALIVQDLIAAEDLVGELGDAIVPSGLSEAQVVAVVAHLATDLPASAPLLGVGLATLAADGELSFSDIRAGLADALAAAVLSFAAAATLLVGAATVEAMAGQAGATLIELIGDDAQRLADTLDAIHAAATGGDLTPSGAVALLVGFAGAGTPSQQVAVGVELASLIELDLTDLGAVTVVLLSDVAGGHISAAGAVVVLLQMAPDEAAMLQVAGVIDHLIREEGLPAGDAAAAIVADLDPDTAATILIQLAQSHVQQPVDQLDAAVIMAAGAALAGLVADGALTADALLGRLENLPAYGGMPLLAAIEAGAGASSALGEAARAALLDYLGGVESPYTTVQYVGQLIGPDGLTAAQGLPILVDMAIHDGLQGQVAAGQVFARAIADHVATMSDVHDALAAFDLAPETAAMILAAMLDPDAATVPAALLREFVVSLDVPPGTTNYLPYIQPVIAALSAAIPQTGPVFQANGLEFGQVVLALSGYAELGFGSNDVRAEVSNAIVALAQLHDQGYEATIGLMAKAAVSLAGVSQSLADNLGGQIAHVATAFELTAEQLADAVVSAVGHGLTAADVAQVLAFISVSNPASSDTAAQVLYPDFGLAAGAAFAGLVGSGLTFADALDLLLDLSRPSPTSHAEFLVGFAGGVTGADQIAVGRALAALSGANIDFAAQYAPIAVFGMIVLGLVEGGSPYGAHIIANMLDETITAMVSSIDAAVIDGALSAAAAVQALALLAGGFGVRPAQIVAFPRAALAGELVSLVPGRISADDALAILLTPQPGAIAQAEAGALIAALVNAGLATAGDVTASIAAALTAGTLTPAQAAVVITGAAISSPAAADLAVALGDYLGGLIEAGSLSIADAMAAIASAQTSFSAGHLPGEIALLAAVAAHDEPGLQAAVGEVLAGIPFSDLFAVLDALVDGPGTLNAQQAKAVLFGMADAFDGNPAGLGGVATEFVALIGRHALTAQEVVDGATAEIAAGHLSMPYGLAFLAYVGAFDDTLVDIVAAEILDLISGGLTVEQAIDGLFLALRGDPAGFVPDVAVAAAIAHVVMALHDAGLVTYAEAADHVSAAEGAGTLAIADAAAILIGMADAADEAEMAALGDALGSIVGHGIDSDSLQALLTAHGIDAGLIQPAAAASLVAYVMGAIAGLPDADDYQAALGAVLAEAAPDVAVAALDRAYEAGGIEAGDVVGLLAHLLGATGASAAIAPELWKMVDEGGVALATVFQDIAAHVDGHTQGEIVGALATSDDPARQIAVGHAVGALIADGTLALNNVLGGIDRPALGDDHYITLALALATGGPAVATGIGLQLASVFDSMGDEAWLERLEDALDAGVLSATELVQVLTGMGSRDLAGDARKAFYALDALVSGDVITADDALSAVHEAASSVSLRGLVHWLASASASAELHDAIAGEIDALIDDGMLGEAQALGYIGEITQAVGGISIGWATAAELLVSLAAVGEPTLQDAVGARLAAVATASSLIRSTIDAALADGSLSAEGATHVIAGLVAALTSDPSGTIRNWAASHLDAFVTDGLIDAATVSSVLLAAADGATTAALPWLGALMGVIGADLGAIGDAIDNGTLTAEQGLQLLLGIGATLDIADPAFQAARDEIAGLVQAGVLTGAQVMEAARAATESVLLSESHVDAIAMSIFGHGSAADDVAIGAHFATRVEHLGDRFGLGDDAYLAGILDETGLTFLKVQTGDMTAAEAIAHIKEYAAAHDLSAYAGIFALNGLFYRYQNGDGFTLAQQERTDMVAIGDLAAELAGRVAEGTTSAYVRDAAGLTHFDPADPNALTRAEALQILRWEAGLAFLPEQAVQAEYMFANELWVAQQVRLDSSPMSPIFMSSVIDGMRPGNPFFNDAVPDVGRSAYAYDLALVTLIERVTAPDRAPDLGDYRTALGELSTRLLKGIAESTLIQQYVAGNLSFEQVLEALDKEAAAVSLGPDGADREMMHDISLAWLQLRARQFVAANPGTDGALMVGQLLLQLQDAQYADDVLTGYGAILGMSSSGASALVTSLDKQAAYDEAFATIRSRTPSHLTLSERDQAVIDTLTTMGNGMAFVLDRHPLGRTVVTVLDDPTDAAAYARFGGQIAAVAANKAAVDALFAGTPWGAAVTAAKFGAQLGLYVLSMGAVQDALGEGPTAYLRGQLTMVGATASLLGNTISDLGAAGAEIAIASAPHFIAFSDAAGRGDVEGMASAIGEVALDYYMLQTGVDPRLYVAVAERFGDLIVHLFTGDTGALGDDVRALGSAYLDTIIKNPYLAAIGSRMVEYAETINGALADINDSYRILGENVLTGLLLVGTHLDEAGNAVRSVLHTVGGVIGDILHGLGIDGYIADGTVFADANFNGVLDAGEAWTTTDANGHYAIQSNGAPLVLQGGFDTATNLPFTGTMLAPAGASTITPLTTLVQRVAEAGSGDPVAAQQIVAAALGLHSGLDLDDLDPIAATRAGVVGAADAFANAASILNTVSLLEAAGAAGDPFEALADQIAAAAADRRILNLVDAATIAGLAAAAGVSPDAVDAVTHVIVASNALTEHAAATASDPLSFLQSVTAVSITAQGSAAAALAAAGTNAALLADVVARYTGANLADHVAADRDGVGDFGDSAGGGEVPLKVSADGLGIELSLDSHNVAGNWIRLDVTDSGPHAGATLMMYAVDAAGNLVSRLDRHSGSDVVMDQAHLATIGSVVDDHGGDLFLGGQSVFLRAGEQLRFAVLSGSDVIDVAPSTALVARSDGSLQATVGGLEFRAYTNNALTDAAEAANAQRAIGDAFVFLDHGDTLRVEVAGSAANTNTLGFVRVDIDAATGAWSVGGVAYGDTQAFHDAVRSQMDAGFLESHGGDFGGSVSWTVAGARGFYAPVLITQSGDTFVVGNANPGGHEQIRMFGENTFGFEDLAYNQGSDFDYNDMVIRLNPDHIL